MSERQTVVWIGQTLHPEFAEAFQYCCQHAGQLAIRATIDEAVKRPAMVVGIVFWARTDRSFIASNLLGKLRSLYPTARFVLVAGSNAEGEGRTGQQFQDWQRCAWHSWSQWLPQWVGVPRANPVPALLTLVIAAGYQHAQPLIDAVADFSRAVSWSTPQQTLGTRGATHVIWDDSAATPAGQEVWRQRLSSLAGSADQRHAWAVSYPRQLDWSSAKLAGVGTLLSKPYRRFAIDRFLCTAESCQ